MTHDHVPAVENAFRKTGFRAGGKPPAREENQEWPRTAHKAFSLAESMPPPIPFIDAAWAVPTRAAPPATCRPHDTATSRYTRWLWTARGRAVAPARRWSRSNRRLHPADQGRGGWGAGRAGDGNGGWTFSWAFGRCLRSTRPHEKRRGGLLTLHHRHGHASQERFRHARVVGRASSAACGPLKLSVS